MTYIVEADLTARIGSEAMLEILDDDVSGAVDAANLTRAIDDAESTVESFMRKVYDLTALRALGVNAPNEVKRLCLEMAVGYLWDRFPEYVRVDGRRLRQDALDELKDIARGLRRLDDIDTIEDTAQVDVRARSGDPDDPTASVKVFQDPDGFGVF